MRILYLHPKSWSGEYAVLIALRELGHEVCVLEEQRGLKPRRWLCSEDFQRSGDGIASCWYDPGRGFEKLLTWPFDRAFKRAFDGRNLLHRMWAIKRAVHHFRPDVMICSDGFAYAIPASFLRQLKLVGTPLVVSYIGGDILHCPQAEYGRSRSGLTGRLIERSYGGISILRPVSPMLRDVLVGDGVAGSRIRVCPSHLVAAAETLARIRGQRTQARARVRSRWRIPLEAPVIVTLGANIKGKGPHILARAWPAVKRALPDARWLLCGPQSPWLREAALPLLAPDSAVICTGLLEGEAVFEHLAAADLHVNPSLCEGLNMVTVEAGAVGTPTISTSSAGIAAWVERYEAGAVIPAGEADRLATAIIDAFLQPNRLALWSAAAIAMSGEFALERIAGELVEILQRAVDSIHQ